MTGQCLQSQQQTRERSHVSHYQGKVAAYPVTHRFHWPVTTIRHHQPGIIMFNRFYLGPTSNTEREWMGFSNYFCLNTRGEARTFAWRHYLQSLYFCSPLKLLGPASVSSFSGGRRMRPGVWLVLDAVNEMCLFWVFVILTFLLFFWFVLFSF